MPHATLTRIRDKFVPVIKERVLPEAAKTLKVGFPIMIAQLIQMSMTFIDTVLAGRLSAVDLAAVAVGYSLMMPFMVFGMGTVMSINPIVAQRAGSRRFDKIGSSLRQTSWVSQLLALLFFLILRNLDKLMILIGIEGEVIPVAGGYLKAISWGMFPVMAYGALRYFNEGLSVTRPGMYAALIGLIFNIPLNYILMYGSFGFPPLGAIGTGYATATVYLLMFLFMMGFTWRFEPYRRFHLFDRFRLPEKRSLKEILGLGLPIGVSSAMEMSLFAIVSLMMATLGTVAVAAHQIAINVSGMTYMIPFGLSMAITARVGHSAGRGDTAEARFRGYVGVALCTLFMCLTAVLIILFPDVIASIYTVDMEVAALAVQMLFMAAIFQLSDGLQVGGFGALRGLKDTRFPMVVNIIPYAGAGLSLAWLFGIHLDYGPIGLWTGLITGLTLAAIMHNIRFWWKTRPDRSLPAEPEKVGSGGATHEKALSEGADPERTEPEGAEAEEAEPVNGLNSGESCLEETDAAANA